MKKVELDRPGRNTPARQRAIFGRNLKDLIAEKGISVSGLCRQLGINRTQFNRYLSGESFPRPDILARICNHFEVDARILLEPVELIRQPATGFLSHPELDSFLSTGMATVPEDLLPNGFFRYVFPSSLAEGKFLVGIAYVYRRGGVTFMRGYIPRSAMAHLGIGYAGGAHESRGFVTRQGAGLAVFAVRRGASSADFTYIQRVSPQRKRCWHGFRTRAVPESDAGLTVGRIMLEYLGRAVSDALPAARKSGYRTRGDLTQVELDLLRPDEPVR
ncbi:helix-turn-helix domain-containing protein [Rhodovulum sp. YNF3179]|uniref:helix-turn-helix domain-containing protein n=1 Tax=Rhodovulum sp. YNF3179 TaxID=3425127 RepID=UPI003D32C77B